MALLGTVSFMSWYWIFRKWFSIRDAKKKTDLFERDFWSGGDLNALYQSAATSRHEAAGMERIFEAGYRGSPSCAARASTTGRSWTAPAAPCAHLPARGGRLEAHLALASVGSVSPYVGLFGTVWGS
jgi:biopolymer transport protein TolQ